MGVLDKVEIIDDSFNPYYNTRTMFDLATGIFVPGVNGEFILNGGLGPISSNVGRQNRYKSSEMFSKLLSAMSIYPGSDLVAYDTEETLQKSRVLSLGEGIAPGHDFSNRIKLCTRARYKGEDYLEIIDNIAEEKIKHKKDYMVELPHVDQKTGKGMVGWVPTFAAIDSWSEFESKDIDAMYEENDPTSSKMNTLAMKDGLFKTRVMTRLSSYCKKAGIYFYLTGHVGDKIEMDMYKATPKNLTWMKQGDKLKGMGSKFDFLCSFVAEIRTSKPLVDDKKEAVYPYGLTPDTDLNLIDVHIPRSKNGPSGNYVPTIISQGQGVLPSLTNYHYLKEMKFGLDGSPISTRCLLYPDVSFNRKTVREKLQDQKMERAIEIMAHLCWIQHKFNLATLPFDASMPVEKFVEMLGSSSIKMDDILTSRGWWTYDKNEKRPFMSILDILSLINKK